MKYDIPGQHRWEDPPQRIGEPGLGILPSGILFLIDTYPGSHNMGYVMRANSSALTLRLVWQSSLATLPFCRRSATRAVLTEVTCPAQGAKVGRLHPQVCHH